MDLANARLVIQAIGGPAQIAGKLRRLGVAVAHHVDPRRAGARFDRLRAHGYLDRVPSRAQLLFGGIDMVRFVIEPAAREYYRTRRISWSLHHLLRFLDDPAASLDPTGLLSARDTIIGHLLQVVHLGCCDPVYDLQVLEGFDDGLDELERQVRAMLDGTHPRHAAIAAIIADPDYHRRLLDYVARFRSSRGAPAPFCAKQPLLGHAEFVAAQQTFTTLGGFLRYAADLPASPIALMRRLFEVRRFPMASEESSWPGPAAACQPPRP